MRSRIVNPFDRYAGSQVDKGEIPGLSALVAWEGHLLFQGTYGWRALVPFREPLSADTLYDLASLTKPLITAFLAVYLQERGLVQLDDEVRRYIPEVGFGFTLRQLLTHTSGLPDWFPFYLYHPPGPISVRAFSGIPLRASPGKRVIYSCVGYMLLCRVLEAAAGQRLTLLAEEVLLRPLRLASTFFSVPAERIAFCAPTEEGNRWEREMSRRFDSRAAAAFAWRTEMIQGKTHDLNSFHQGGFAGNSGLFASALDLWRLALEFLPQAASILHGDSLDLFWKNATKTFRAHRTIGFKLNSSLVTSGGPALEPDAIGHNGFTGTSLWLERRSGRVWILLSNRVHPRVPKRSFDPLRRRLHSRLAAQLGLA